MESTNKSSLAIIVAMDDARGIGIQNRLPWELKEDLAHFKKTTAGRPIIMGRKTFDSIGRVLPGRRNIVLSRKSDLIIDGAEVESSLAGACMRAGAGGDGLAYIIGGAEIFEMALEFVDKLVITEIHAVFHCDTFFPPIDKNIWKEVSRESFTGSASDLKYSIVHYERL